MAVISASSAARSMRAAIAAGFAVDRQGHRRQRRLIEDAVGIRRWSPREVAEARSITGSEPSRMPDRRAVRAAYDRTHLVDPAPAVGDRARRTPSAESATAQRAALLGGQRRDLVADRLGLDAGHRQPHVTAVRAARAALHVVAVARVTRAKKASTFAASSGYRDIGFECRPSNEHSGHGPQRHRRLHQGRRDQELHRGGRALGLPKSTVSRKLAQLEERLGVRLVQRTTRKLALTEIGEAYYERCARIVADVSRPSSSSPTCSRRRAAGCASPRRSTSRRATSARSSPTSSRMHPEINVELEATDGVVDLIEDGFDLAVRFGPMPESTLIARRLCTLSLVLVASPAYLAKRGTPKSIDELDEHDHVLFTPTSRNQTLDAASTASRPTSSAARRGSRATTTARCATSRSPGGGIALLSDFMIADDLAAGRLVHVLPEWRTRVDRGPRGLSRAAEPAAAAHAVPRPPREGAQPAAVGARLSWR